MLSLYYKLEDKIELNGNEYNVNLAFDNILRLIDMLNDNEITDRDKVILGNKMLLGVALSLSLDEEVKVLTTLLETFVIKKSSTAVETDLQGNPMPPKYKEDKENNYSLKHDAEYIFASFYQAYRMDLVDQQGKLHWEKFNALLAGLPSDTKFKEVLEIRNWKPYKGCGKEEKKHMKELQKIYALPAKEGES